MAKGKHEHDRDRDADPPKEHGPGEARPGPAPKVPPGDGPAEPFGSGVLPDPPPVGLVPGTPAVGPPGVTLPPLAGGDSLDRLPGVGQAAPPETVRSMIPPPKPAAAPAAPAAATAGTPRARVSVPGTHFAPVEVDVPADAPDRTAAAIDAAKRATGVWSFGAGPVVEWL